MLKLLKRSLANIANLNNLKEKRKGHLLGLM